jgi:hypothetical protein
MIQRSSAQTSVDSSVLQRELNELKAIVARQNDERMASVAHVTRLQKELEELREGEHKINDSSSQKKQEEIDELKKEHARNNERYIAAIFSLENKIMAASNAIEVEKTENNDCRTAFEKKLSTATDAAVSSLEKTLEEKLVAALHSYDNKLVTVANSFERNLQKVTATTDMQKSKPAENLGSLALNNDDDDSSIFTVQLVSTRQGCNNETESATLSVVRDNVVALPASFSSNGVAIRQRAIDLLQKAGGLEKLDREELRHGGHDSYMPPRDGRTTTNKNHLDDALVESNKQSSLSSSRLIIPPFAPRSAKLMFLRRCNLCTDV